MTSDDRNNLGIASSSSLHFYERIRRLRESKALVEAGRFDEIQLGSDVGNEPELEATFLRSGIEIQKLLAIYPSDRDIIQALVSHDARAVDLGLTPWVSTTNGTPF